MSVDWIVGWWSTNAPGQSSAGSAVYYQLITPDELEDKGDSLRVVRVVGQFYLENVDDTVPLMLHCRLVVRPSDGTTPYTASIQPADMAEEKLMWHKVIRLLPSQTNFETSDHPEWSHLDVTVKRALNDNEVLLFIMEPITDFTESALDIFKYAAWLRVLVSS